MTLLINPIAVPLQIGRYDADRLVETVMLEGRASDTLLGALEAILDRHSVERIIYANGPGSYLSVKLTYIALATLEIVLGIPFAACSAFALNGNRPIRAMGSLYFIKEKETIITQKIDENVPQDFELPGILDALTLAPERIPLYILPAA